MILRTPCASHLFYRGTMLCAAWLCLYFLYSTLRLHVLAENHGCSSLLRSRTESLKNCTFQDNDRTVVRCDILNMIQDNGEYVDHLFYLHYGVLFKVIEPIADGSTLCLGIILLVWDRVNEEWDNSTVGDLSLDFYTLLRYVDYGYLKAEFNYSIPAAIAELDDGCQSEEDRRCNPILNVKLLLELKRPASSLNVFDESYWNSIKKRYSAYGGHNTQLRLDFDKKFGVFKPNYLQGVLQGYNIIYLRLTGGNWVNLDTSLLANETNTLTHLDLSSNSLKHINNGSFEHISKVENFVLSDNKFEAIPIGIEKLTLLKHLDLSGNPIKKHSSFNEISHLPLLKVLSLAHVKLNDLSTLQPLFSTCEMGFQLEVLNLSYCDIQTLSSNEFNCQKELRVLDLSHNRLREIPPEIVSTQRYLEALNISNNILTTSPQLLLHDNVKILDISHNRLHYVGNTINSGKVKFLDMSGNNVTVWSNTNIFGRRIENTNLSRNSITFVSREMIESLQILDSVDLGENLYDCLDCNMPEFQNWLRTENTTKIFNLGTEEPLTCVVPAANRGRSIVNIEFDEALCLTNYMLVVGVPIIVILLVISIIAVILYFYRFELTYLVHLVNIKKKSAQTNDSTERYKYDAFVCYSGNDRAWVIGDLMPTLESKPDKYMLCLHERDFPLGSFITQNIVSSLQTSRATIVVLTNNFIKSEWCRRELELANHKLFEDRREFLILIELEKIDRSSLPRHLKFLMDTRTYLEWPQNNEISERAWKRLKEALGPSMHKLNSRKQEETAL